MDPLSALGAAASIVQLVQVSAELSVKFYTISKQIKNAPKVFEELSNEIASTTTILQLLASELEDQTRLQLHKPAAVQKTKELITDCAAIYETMRKKITPEVDENASDGAKSRAQWKKRLKMPYMAGEFVELRDRLMGVKTWLNVMLSTLSLGVQAKSFSGSQEAKDLLLEQRQMLELLMQETRLLRERAGQRSPSSFKPGVQEAGETGDKGVQNPFKQSTNTSSISLAGSMATLVNTNAIGSNVGHLSTNSPTSTANTQLNAKGQGAGMEDGSSASRGSDALPAEMSFYAREIQEQARLITDMIETIDQRSYAISRKTRSLMHEQTLNLHLQQWKELAQRFGYKYLVSMVESFPDLLDNWTAAMFAARTENPEKEKVEPSQSGNAFSFSPATRSAPHLILSTAQNRKILVESGKEHDIKQATSPLWSTKLDDPQFPPEQLSDFREVFDMFDEGETGYIHYKDLLTILRSLGQNPSEQNLNDYLDQLQPKDNDKLTFNEFLRLMQITSPADVHEEPDLREAFKVFDRGTESISADELRTVMKSLGENITDTEINEMIKETAGPDGQIDYQEFTQMLTGDHDKKQRTEEQFTVSKPTSEMQSHEPEGGPTSVTRRYDVYDDPQQAVSKDDDKAEDPDSKEKEVTFVDLQDVSLIRRSAVREDVGATYGDSEDEDDLYEQSPGVSKDVDDLLREYTMLTEEDLKVLEPGN